MFRLLATTTAIAAVSMTAIAAVAASGGGGRVASAVTVETAPAVPLVRSVTEATRTVDSGFAPYEEFAEEVGIRPNTSLRPIVSVVDADAEERVRVDEALARFRDAGLRLPDVEIMFHDDDDACNGHHGLFQVQFTPWRAHVCSGYEYVVTHELAHAWEAANLDDADRDAYVAHRGLETWSSSAVGWGERGVEDAAFMIQQNLMARTVNVDSDRWVERTSAFAALTSLRSPVLGGDVTAGPLHCGPCRSAGSPTPPEVTEPSVRTSISRAPTAEEEAAIVVAVEALCPRPAAVDFRLSVHPAGPQCVATRDSAAAGPMSWRGQWRGCGASSHVRNGSRTVPSA